jgi:hypothetical protein
VALQRYQDALTATEESPVQYDMIALFLAKLQAFRISQQNNPLIAYSGDCCHLIRRKAAIRSGVKLPPVPEEGCHPFQAKAATPSERSDAWFDQVTWTQFPLSMVQRVVCASILL